MNAATDASRYRVPALERGLQILQMFDLERSTLSPPEIARDLRLPRTTVFRLLQTLEDLGYVERVAGRAFRLSGAAHSFAVNIFSSLDLLPAVYGLVGQLRDETGYTALLAIRDGDVARVVFHAPGGGASCSCRGGVGLPADASALGRSLLFDAAEPELIRLSAAITARTGPELRHAHLAELWRVLAADRKRGYAIAPHATAPGSEDIAAPVRRRDGRLFAAVGIAHVVESGQPLAALADKVLAAASAIAATLPERTTRLAAS